MNNALALPASTRTPLREDQLPALRAGEAVGYWLTQLDNPHGGVWCPAVVVANDPAARILVIRIDDELDTLLYGDDDVVMWETPCAPNDAVHAQLRLARGCAARVQSFARTGKRMDSAAMNLTAMEADDIVRALREVARLTGREV